MSQVEQKDTKQDDIKPIINDFSAAGELTISFDPPKASVPENWDALWNKDVRNQMSASEKQVLDEFVADVF